MEVKLLKEFKAFLLNRHSQERDMKEGIPYSKFKGKGTKILANNSM